MNTLNSSEGEGINRADLTAFTGYYSIFKENAEKIGAEVFRVSNNIEGRLLIEDILDCLKARRIAAAPSPLVNALGLDNLSKNRVEFKNLEHEANQADVGICSVELAVVETGSLCQIDPTLDERRLSKLVETNIILVRTDRLVPSLREAMEKIHREWNPLPFYISLISGPSRTSDIERVLTIGVHGPEKLIIVFVDQLIGGD